MTYGELLHAIVAWAKGREDVLAAVLTGSRAQIGAVVDPLSDLDIELVTQDPSALANDASWLERFGEFVTVLPLGPSPGQRWATRLAIYRGGLKVDFTLAGRARLEEMAAGGSLDPLYERGYALLLDKVGLAHGLPPASGRFPILPLPSQEEFRAAVEEFWFEASHVPKYLARGELWLVKQRDWTMKELLLRMMEWHSVARRDGAVDVRHIGTRLRDWLDGSVWQKLHAVFAHFGEDDSRRALRAMAALYGRLGRETAAAAGLRYPQHVEDAIMAHVNASFCGSPCAS